MAARDHLRPTRRRLLEGDSDRTLEPARRKPLPHGCRQRRDIRTQAVILAPGFERRIEAAHSPFHEAVDISWSAKQAAPALPLRFNFFRIDRVLGKPRAGAALALFGIAPDCLHGLGVGGEAEVET